MPLSCTAGASSSSAGGFGRRLPTGHRISHLVVGGGGGGGTGNGTATGGGGGAGAVRRSVRDLLTFGTTYDVVVGLGGATNVAGNSSSFKSITASGGGAGGVPGVNSGSGGNGGSGGGGAGGSGAGATPSGAGTGTTGGNAGGVGNSGDSSYACAGGGGGAGGVGAAGVSASQNGGVGGVGISDNITGADVFYGGGGGGANAGSGNPAAGGNGGGGAGVGTGAGVAGTANTGGGGGGGSANNAGGAGGSGVVILSIPTEYYSGIHTGSPTVTVSGSTTILKFTANGSYTAEYADQHRSSVKLHMPFDTDTADKSTVGRTITVNGTTISTSTKKWGAGSLSLPALSDYLTAAQSADFDFGSGGFTVETWIKTTQSTTYGTIAFYANGFTGWVFMTTADGSKLRCAVANGSAETVIEGTITINDGNWHHVAMTHDGATFRCFVDGVADTSVANTYNIASATTSLYIGRWSTAIRALVGHIDDFRITKGVARYTGSYPIPTSPFPGASNTILLVNFNGTNASTTFTDLSNAAHTLTAGASAQITTTGPQFGTGALSVPGGNSFMGISGSPTSMGFGATDDFCIEFWVNPTSVSGPTFMDFRDGGAGGAMGPVIFCSSGTLNVSAAGGAFGISGGTVSANVYSHIAFCRAAGVSRAFLNGAQIGQSVADTNNYITNSTLRFGCNGNNTGALDGKIDGIRIKRGIGAGIYTTNFTVPAVELTV